MYTALLAGKNGICARIMFSWITVWQASPKWSWKSPWIRHTVGQAPQIPPRHPQARMNWYPAYSMAFWMVRVSGRRYFLPMMYTGTVRAPSGRMGRSPLAMISTFFWACALIVGLRLDVGTLGRWDVS